jgi:acyl-CoA-binding protein
MSKSTNESPSSSPTPHPNTTSTPTSTKTTASEFRAKVLQIKNWKPKNTPVANRDRLELYALQKQAVAGDAPSEDTSNAKSKNNDGNQSPLDRAKLNAWRTKRGLSQTQAMIAYIIEADRQIAVYGTDTNSSNNAQSTRQPTQSSTEDNDDNRSNHTTTTTSVMLTPRGLAAIPLLSAAASESRSAYLHRLSSTPRTLDGWWQRQEPLCSDPNSTWMVLSLPEYFILCVAQLVERMSLTLSCDESTKGTLGSLGIQPRIIQSCLWPVHNLLLVLWMLIIFISTLVSSSCILFQTMLFGSNRTGTSLDSIFLQEIRPCEKCAMSLCEPHQVLSVRLLGLVLYPLSKVCSLSMMVRSHISAVVGVGSQQQTRRDGLGLFVGSMTFLFAVLGLWWYWILVLPWVAIGGFVCALSIGWCFSVMELAGM